MAGEDVRQSAGPLSSRYFEYTTMNAAASMALGLFGLEREQSSVC